MTLFMQTLLFVTLLIASSYAHAWGKRGHSIICQTAAYLASQDDKDKTDVAFLQAHSFDLGYYCNVPDFIWKRPATYKQESTNHFMDLEIFDKKFPKKDDKENPVFNLTRPEFNQKYEKDIPKKWGRAWWRIQELAAKLNDYTQQLKNTKLSVKQRHDLQAKWLVTAGAMGHYVGDLAMPLHVSENYDGQMTEQKGIHHYFEETVVDELFLQENFGLQEAVYKKALSKWNKYKINAKKKDLLALVQELSRDSQKNINLLLKTDKKNSRVNLEKSSNAYKDMIIDRLAKSALLQAYILESNLGWPSNRDKFFQFVEAPEFIEPPAPKKTSKNSAL